MPFAVQLPILPLHNGTSLGFHSLNNPHPVHISRTPKRLIPKSSYYYGPPPPDTAFGTDPIGQIGIHHPREIVRIERDYSGGEIIQFSAVYPLEFEGRVCLRI